MCGILLSVRAILASSSSELQDDPLFDALLESVKPRGPDSLITHRQLVEIRPDLFIEVKLAASVLGLRGNGVTTQPLARKRGVLAWNGQVFQGMNIGLHENDTAKLFDRLDAGESPLQLLSKIEGPYAFVWYNTVDQEVHFQLDPLTRRSILCSLGPDETSTDRFILCSSRGSDAEAKKVSMRVLDGGEGGVLSLRDIVVQDSNAMTMDLSTALKLHNLAQIFPLEGFARPEPINKAVPSNTTPDRAIEAEVDNFVTALTASVRQRVENIPSAVTGEPRLAVLFSGGVDCTLLAAVIHRCLPLGEPVDLVNVAFERPPNPNTHSKKQKSATPRSETGYDVPDRLSGRQAVDELRSACPGREWRFVEVDIEHEECLAHRTRVLDLMYPTCTEMDLSLAFPLYFASRGVGTVQAETDGPKKLYTVKAKVFISGLGADEQLAGYSRHRHAFSKGGYQGLIDEIQMDIDRLPTRNLSRDDRIISSHARDARFPYLDLEFVSYLSRLPVWAKCDFTQQGGDKLLLRKAAHSLGLIETAQRVKRAMQFGTRSAKIGGGATGSKKGHNLVE